MKYKRFKIRRYRAVDYAEVPVGQALLPLIGINESGKMSILQAILAFDRASDRFNAAQHLDYRNKYDIGDHECTISAEVVIDHESDLDAIAQSLRLIRGNESLRDLEAAHIEGRSLTVTRNLDTKEYSVAGVDVHKSRRLAKAIYRLLPLILNQVRSL